MPAPQRPHPGLLRVPPPGLVQSHLGGRESHVCPPGCFVTDAASPLVKDWPSTASSALSTLPQVMDSRRAGVVDVPSAHLQRLKRAAWSKVMPHPGATHIQCLSSAGSKPGHLGPRQDNSEVLSELRAPWRHSRSCHRATSVTDHVCLCQVPLPTPSAQWSGPTGAP